MKAHYEKRAVEGALAGENRLEDWEANESAVGEDGREKVYFADVEILIKAREGQGEQSHQGMEQKAEEQEDERLVDELPRKFLADQRRDYHHRLTDRDDET